ncbi:M12 family metallopeptidase [Myxococcus eversor]|uniref:M12 family metallopeptidase n=1 Tax=Myxococcus eversor TaxID=2709661 RepID=UPI0013D09A0D|nr:M12 family metallopeptidase [Myxococcus eversor]
MKSAFAKSLCLLPWVLATVLACGPEAEEAASGPRLRPGQLMDSDRLQLAQVEAFGEAEALDVPVVERNGLLLLDGDILVGRASESPSALKQALEVSQFNGIPQGSLRWPEGKIPYVVSNVFTSAQEKMITQAMKEIKDRTGVRFVHRTDEKDFVRIIKTKDGCYYDAGPGRVGGVQELSLMDTQQASCFYHDIIIHELLHAVGLWHEQSRYDRNQFVRIIWDNIQKGRGPQFQIVPASRSDVYDTEYDYRSVMHYDKNAFGVTNTAITIRTKDEDYLNVIGRVESMSANDARKVRRIYQNLLEP